MPAKSSKRTRGRAPGGRFTSLPPEDLSAAAPILEQKPQGWTPKACPPIEPTSVVQPSKRPPVSKATSETDAIDVAKTLMKMSNAELGVIAEESEIEEGEL